MGTKFLNVLMRGITLLVLLSMLASTLPGGALSAQAASGTITRVSVDSGNAQADGGS